MKNLISLALVFILISACGETPSKKDDAKADNTSVKKDEAVQARPSADYSTLLTNYECDMDMAELAKVLEVTEADLSIPDYASPGDCLFTLKGFGDSVTDGGSQLFWQPLPSSKAQNKKEIASYLKRKEEGLKIMGMDIQLAETGDCYLAYQPAQGRMIIYNGNYDQAFLINYGQKNANTDRTKEQHEELRLKMTDLANYLLKKHRK